MTSPHLSQPGYTQKGFTLVELMVVIVIMSIMLGFLMVSIGGGERDKRLQDEAKRISALIKLASEQSLLQSMEIGLLVDEESYQFLTLNDESWQPLPESNFRKRQLPESIQLDLVSVEHAPPPEEPEEPIPQILLLSSGEATSFELEIKDDDIDYYLTLSGTIMGKLTLQQVEY
jgi:general secretion pathway protein H